MIEGCDFGGCEPHSPHIQQQPCQYQTEASPQPTLFKTHQVDPLIHYFQAGFHIIFL